MDNDINEFCLKYKDGMKELSKKLDTYLQGMWYENDYLRGNERSNIIPVVSSNLMLVYFGDSNNRNREHFALSYIESDNSLIITEVNYLTSNAALSCYSKDVLSLVGYTISSKQEDESPKQK